MLTEIKKHDIRNSVTITETMRIRSQARMEQIIASNPSVEKMRSVVSKPRVVPSWQPKTGMKRWGIRLGAIPVAAAAIIAATIVIPGGSEAPSAFSGWTAIPTAVAATLFNPTERACQNALITGIWETEPLTGEVSDIRLLAEDQLGRFAPWAGTAPVIAEQRGDWVLMAYANDTGNTGCLMQVTGDEASVLQTWEWDRLGGGIGSSVMSRGWFDREGNWIDPNGGDGLDFWTGTAIWSPGFDSGISFINFDRSFLQGVGPMMLFRAQVEESLTAIDIPLDSGETVSATISGGMAIAWWPASLGEIQNPEGRPFNWRLTLEATYANGATYELHSLFQPLPRTHRESVRRLQEEGRMDFEGNWIFSDEELAQWDIEEPQSGSDVGGVTVQAPLTE